MLNSVAIMGRMVADPELRKANGDVSVTTFTIAVNRSYVAKGTERQTDFLDIVAWRNTADFICKYFKKGMIIAIEGTLQTRSFVDKEGKNRKAVEILANNVFFCESKNEKAKPNTEVEVSDGFAPVEDDGDLPF